MITFDGDRSKRRLWMAKKQLAVAKNIDVPSRGLLYDGFTITTWHQDDLSGGRVTAPMGAAAIFSLPGKLTTVCTADDWKGPFTDERDVYVIDRYGIWLYSGQPVANVPLTPDLIDTAPAPKLRSYLGETFWVVSSSVIGGNNIMEMFLNFYSASGQAETRYSSSVSLPEETRRIAFNLPGNTVLSVAMQVYEYEYNTETPLDSKTVCGATFRRYRGEEGYQWEYAVKYGLDMFADLPAELRDYVSYPYEVVADKPRNSMRQTGTYACGGTFLQGDGTYTYGETFLQGVDLTATKDPYDTYFSSNDDKWKLFYVIDTGEGPSCVSSDNFLAILDNMSEGRIVSTSTDWSLAALFFQHLFPRPNYAPDVPYDSTMFHDPETVVYTWSRAYGEPTVNLDSVLWKVFRFRATGIDKVELTFPLDSAEDGVTPVLHGWYLCACERVNTGRVDSLHHGSPEGGWTPIEIPEGLEVVHVKPIEVTAKIATFLVVVEKTITVDSEEKQVLYLGIYKDSLWRIMGMLPPTYEDGMRIDTCLFGDGRYVTAMQDNHSVAMPQMPIKPYGDYTLP